ncbi:MAG: OmpA family protein [candidate division WOR-3 bacterium]|nr:MAG: OmpA family protein [candidate division WOR-3 bacterium]
MNILFLVASLFAIFSNDDVGTTMYPLLKIGAGPRAVALGEAYIGLSNDLTAVYWNPSGLNEMSGLQFYISHHEWFLDIRDEYFILGMPGLNGYFALGCVYSSIPGVEIWDENNEPQGTQNLWSGIISLSHGRRIGKKLALGVGLKTVYEDLYEESMHDFAMDIGAKVYLSDKIMLGGALRNISYTWDVPADIKCGCCYQGIDNMRILLDLTLPTDNVPSMHAGVEYAIHEYFSIRTGWRSGPYDLSKLGWYSGLTAGFGITYGVFKLDYAFVPYGKLGVTHRIAVTTSLHRLHPENSLLITVRDGETQQPLLASVTLSGVKTGVFETEQSGQVQFENPATGWVFIHTFSPGYPGNQDSAYVHPEGTTEKTILLFATKAGMFRGIVYDAVTKLPIGAFAEYRGMAYGTIDNNPVTGSFVLRDLPSGAYMFTVSGKDPAYITQTCTVSIHPDRLTEREFYLIKKREKIVLKGVNFETGKAELRLGSFGILDKAGKILQDNPDITVELAGHTDPREISTTEYPSNWELSFARAAVVRAYLIDEFHIAPERLIARGYADTQPIASNDTEEGMAENRRTEFRIIEQ